MTDAPGAARSKPSFGTVGALGAIAIITAVTLVVMGVVLTRDPGTDTGRRTSSGAGNDIETPVATTTSTTAKPKPGLVNPLPDLSDTNGWTADINIANGGTCAGPAVLGTVVSVFCDTRHMVGFDIETGEQLWDTKTDDDVQTFIPSPTAAGTHLFVYPRGNEIVAVEAATGAIAWRTPREGVILGMAATEKQVLAIGGGAAVALDPETGAVLWETPFTQDVFTQGAIQVSASTLDVVVTIGTGIQALNVDTGEPHWTATVGTLELLGLHATPEAVYVVSSAGTVTALDAATGTSQWEQKGMFGRNQQMIGGVDNDTIYLSSTDELGALSRQDGSKVWSFTSGEALQQPEGIDRSHFENGHLISRGQGQVWDIDPKTGVVEAGKRMNTAGPGRVHNDKLFILQATFGGLASWRLHALGL